MAKLWGIKMALEVAYMIGFKNVLLESDSSTAVSLIMKGLLKSSSFSCDHFHNKPASSQRLDSVCLPCVSGMQSIKWRISLLVSLASSLAIDFLFFNSPLPCCISFLWEDVVGVFFPRNVLV